MPFNSFFLEPQQVDSHHRSGTQHGIGKHIDNDMRSEPRTLQSGHQRLVVYFGPKNIDADKHQGQDGTETENPFVPPTTVSDDSCQWKKE